MRSQKRTYAACMKAKSSMTDKADHLAWAAEAVAVFQEHCRTGTNMPSQT